LPAPAIFHREALGAKAPFLNPRIAGENVESSGLRAKNAKKANKKGKKNIS
jgi:hypothetical protein